MATIYLIRHGESAANAGLKTFGTATIPLTPLGQSQAQEVPEHLPNHLEYIIHSTYLRTKETAKPTINAYPTATVEEWPEVREFTYLDPVKCMGSTMAERKPMVEKFWETLNPDLQMHPTVESFGQFIKRVKAAHLLLNERFGGSHKNVAVFTHALFMKAFFQVAEKPDASAKQLMSEFFDCPVIHNCDIFTYEL